MVPFVMKGQDTIIKKAGEVILCKITKVTSANVFYTENKIGKSIPLSETGYVSKPSNIPQKTTEPATTSECDVKKIEDKFDGSITYSTGLDWAMFYKFQKGAMTSYSLRLEADGSTSNYYKTGVVILLEDGSKIEKPNAKIDCKSYSNYGYKFSSWVDLTISERELLKSKRITDFRLYIYEKSISEKKGQKLIGSIKCISESN